LHHDAELQALRKSFDETHARLSDSEAKLIDRDAQIVVKDASIFELHTRLKSATALAASAGTAISPAAVKAATDSPATTPGNSPEKKKKRSSIFSGAKKGWSVIRGLAGVENKKEEDLPPPLPEVEVESDPAELRQMVEDLQAELAERDAELMEAKLRTSGANGATVVRESRFFEPMIAKAQQWKPVHSMVRWESPEHIAKLKDLLKEKPEILKLQDPRSLNVVLHISAQNGHEETTRVLLAAGADCNVKNCTGQTPLHMAMAYDYAEIVTMLRAAGAQDDLRNDNGFTAISGIDGNKNTGLLSLSQANSSKAVYLALDEIASQVPTTDVAEYVKIYLESKRTEPASWGKREVRRFKEIFRLLGDVPPPQPHTYVEEVAPAADDTSKEENKALREELAAAIAAADEARAGLQQSLSSASDEKKKLAKLTQDLVSLQEEKTSLVEVSAKASKVAQEATQKLSDRAAEVKQLKAQVSALTAQLQARRSPLASPLRRKLTGGGGLDSPSATVDSEGKAVHAAGAEDRSDGVNESVLLGESGVDEFIYTHDDASLTEELIMTKMSLALANSDLEQMQYDYKASTRTVDELKDLVDVLRASLAEKAKSTSIQAAVQE